MNDPFVSYDTFSVGSEFDAQQDASAPATPRDIPLLARLERLTAAKPPAKKRFDEAESALTGIHFADSIEGYEADTIPMAEPRRSPPGNPAATIRVDTISPTSYDDLSAAAIAKPEPRPVAQPANATMAAPLTPPSGVDTLEDPWAAWLLNLESAVLPYSRIIVLAAVIAALGLTLVLLQGGSAPTDTTGGAPQVQIESDDAVLAATANEAPPLWSAEPVTASPAESLANDGLRPLDTPATSVFASGPASAPRATGHATLVGEVRAVPATRVNVADATGQPNFSRTK